MTYLLDANVFIQARNLHYGFDFCSGFWDWLVERNEAGLVFSIEKVGDELVDDELRAWTRARGRSFFLPPDEPMLDSLRKVADWVTRKGYEPTGIATFLSGADYYLVAHAHAHGHEVVTHEVHSSDQRPESDLFWRVWQDVDAMPKEPWLTYHHGSRASDRQRRSRTGAICGTRSV